MATFWLASKARTEIQKSVSTKSKSNALWKNRRSQFLKETDHRNETKVGTLVLSISHQDHRVHSSAYNAEPWPMPSGHIAAFSPPITIRFSRPQSQNLDYKGYGADTFQDNELSVVFTMLPSETSSSAASESWKFPPKQLGRRIQLDDNWR